MVFCPAVATDSDIPGMQHQYVRNSSGTCTYSSHSQQDRRTDTPRSCWVGYSTRVPAGICRGIYPTQLAGRFVLLSYPYPNPGQVLYYSRYLTQIPVRLGSVLPTLPYPKSRIGLVLLSALYSTSSRVCTRVSTRDLGIYPVPGELEYW